MIPEKIHAPLILCVIAGMVVFLFSAQAMGFASHQRTEISQSRYNEFSHNMLHYREGDSPDDVTVVFLHGFGENLRTWEPLLGYWEGEEHILLVDLPGQGRSRPARMENYSHRNQARLLGEFISEKGREKAVLVGHSMGANLALRIALSMPEMVVGIVLLSPAVYTARGIPFARFLVDFPFTRVVASTLVRRLVRSPGKLADILRESVYDPGIVDEDMVERLINPLVDNPRSRLALLYLFRDSGRNHVLPDFSLLDMPVLIIQGADDPLVPLQHAESLQNIVPDADLVILKRCGHLPHEEKPHRVAQELNQFLRKLDAQRVE